MDNMDEALKVRNETARLRLVFEVRNPTHQQQLEPEANNEFTTRTIISRERLTVRHSNQHHEKQKWIFKELLFTCKTQWAAKDVQHMGEQF